MQRSVVVQNVGVILSALLLAVVVCLSFSKGLPAALPVHATVFQVAIDGTDYGIFEHVHGIESALTAQGHYRVTLERNFVARPSLSLWAKHQLTRQQVLRDIVLTLHDERGNERRFVLRYCQPLSWTVEAVSPAMDGYHEVIDLAVQEISPL